MSLTKTLEGAAQLWNKINLTNLQKDLDTQSLEIIQNQGKSLDSRKRLVGQTKEFKQLANPTLQDFKTLLKEYQSEIDSLNNRCKTAETLYLNVYKTLAEVPDPGPVFETALSSYQKVSGVENLESENQKLQTQITQLTAELDKKSSLEKQVQSLNADIVQLKQSHEQTLQAKVAEATKELQSEMEDRVRIYKETEHSLQKQLNHIRDEFTRLQNNREYTQASSHSYSDHYNDQVSSKLAELEILTLDLSNTQSKLERITRENYVLKEQLISATDESRYQELENKLKFEREEHERHLEYVMEKAELLKKSALERLNEEEIASQALNNFTVAEQAQLLKEYADYDEIKRELEIFRSVEMGQESNFIENISLERGLLEKNKKLENDLTTVRMELQDLITSVNFKDLELAQLREDLLANGELIAKLEGDIHRLNEMRPQVASPSENLENLLQDIGTTGGTTVSKKPDSSIIPILTSQRNRYKQRFEEAQRSNVDLESKIVDLSNEINRLQNDNLLMYEKLRYQESYQTQHSSYQIESRSQRNSIVQKYKTLYEDSIDPFQKFKEVENRRAEQMNPAEKIAMQFTKLLTANKYSRIIFVLYSGLLHLLVFISMYELATIPTKDPKPTFNIPNKAFT